MNKIKNNGTKKINQFPKFKYPSAIGLNAKPTLLSNADAINITARSFGFHGNSTLGNILVIVSHKYVLPKKNECGVCVA